MDKLIEVAKWQFTPWIYRFKPTNYIYQKITTDWHADITAHMTFIMGIKQYVQTFF
jgi:hypothetical protein